ncbi:RNA polymerase sigma factor [Cohnella cellulosilytica]|uniref:RNA polymerase sigma factor n=1 Tax=Cohnella cellulosilytica TaxID=986710 RepID=A0ABW2FGM9_9BACL
MDWKPILSRYSLRIAGNPQDAEDLAQDAWLKLSAALGRQPDRPITKAFLYRIVTNAWIDGRRKRAVRAVSWKPGDDAGSSDPSLSTRELLEALAERLPPRMAVILLLMDIFDFTAKETAALIGMREGAVQVALGRARRRLRSLAADSAPAKPVPGSPLGPVRFDALVEAFRERDPGRMIRAYLGLSRDGIRLSGLRQVDGRLHFTFQDSDGNRFQIVQK